MKYGKYLNVWIGDVSKWEICHFWELKKNKYYKEIKKEENKCKVNKKKKCQEKKLYIM